MIIIVQACYHNVFISSSSKIMLSLSILLLFILTVSHQLGPPGHPHLHSYDWSQPTWMKTQLMGCVAKVFVIKGLSWFRPCALFWRGQNVHLLEEVPRLVWLISEPWHNWCCNSSSCYINMTFSIYYCCSICLLQWPDYKDSLCIQVGPFRPISSQTAQTDVQMHTNTHRGLKPSYKVVIWTDGDSSKTGYSYHPKHDDQTWPDLTNAEWCQHYLQQCSNTYCKAPLQKSEGN